MCVDYTSLNKGCLKDPFALPRIDQVVDLTTPCRGGPVHHHVHHSLRLFLLRKNAIQTKQCSGHLPTVYAVLFQRINRLEVYVNDIIMKSR
jgi:hypothetical protein